MAKKSQIARTKKRHKLVEKYWDKRKELTSIIKDPNSTQAQRQEAYRKLRKLPRDSSPTRRNNRCKITGRSRGFLRKFGMSRIAFRELALKGELPGVVKASW